jgi:spermidine/putrescine transport system permease protein
VTRVLAWFTNPWGRPRFLALFAVVYMAWSIVPILVAVRFSFNEGRSRSTAQGWSTRWYWDEPDLSVWNDPTLREALFQSLKLASLAMAIAVPLGIALALSLTRWRSRGAGTARFVSVFPLITPEIVLGTALFLTFIHLFRFVELGTTAQLLGHVTFSISFVVIIVRGRLLSIGREYEEAAMDLGASPVGAIGRVLLPLLSPAILASVAIVFAAAIDNFVISQQLSSGAGTQTIPILIYSAARRGPLPSVNALASITLLASTFVIALAVLFYRRRTAGERAESMAGLPI